MMSNPGNTLRELGFSLRATFIPLSKAGPNDYPHGLCVNWRVEIFFHRGENTKPVVDTTYRTGIAHLQGYREHSGKLTSIDGAECLRQALERGVSRGYAPFRVVQPSLADVMQCLLLDAEALSYARFEDWADSYGYDPDSRTAEAVYRACLDIGLRLRAACEDDVLTRAYEAVEDL